MKIVNFEDIRTSGSRIPKMWNKILQMPQKTNQFLVELYRN